MLEHILQELELFWLQHLLVYWLIFPSSIQIFLTAFIAGSIEMLPLFINLHQQMLFRRFAFIPSIMCLIGIVLGFFWADVAIFRYMKFLNLQIDSNNNSRFMNWLKSSVRSVPVLAFTLHKMVPYMRAPMITVASTSLTNDEFIKQSLISCVVLSITIYIVMYVVYMLLI